MRNVARGAGQLRRRRWYRFREEDFKENDMSETNIQEVVRQKYGEAAKQVTAGGTACCGGGGESCWSGSGFTGMRKSDRAGEIAGWRSGAGLGVRRRN